MILWSIWTHPWTPSAHCYNDNNIYLLPCIQIWIIHITNHIKCLSSSQVLQPIYRKQYSHTYFYSYVSVEKQTFIITSCSGGQYEDHLTKNGLERQQDFFHIRDITKRSFIYETVHTLVGVSISWKFQMHPSISCYYKKSEVRCMYKDVNDAKNIRLYIGSLEIHIGYPTVHYEDNQIWIDNVKYDQIKTIVESIDIIFNYL